MNALVITFLLVGSAALLLIPRRWAPLPLLIGVCYIIPSQELQIGSLHFTAIRILISVGLVRMIIRGERLSGRMNGLDWSMIAWAFWAVSSSVFWEDILEVLVNRLGLVYDACGIYFLLRVFCKSLDDVIQLCRITAVLLVPVALEMIYERLTSHNLFYELVGSNIGLYIRHDTVRAQGPFGHSILAGTIGAVCLPLMITLWRQHRKIAMFGIGSCLVMIVTAASSGPFLSTMAAIVALLMYRHRHHMRFVRWLMVAGYIALDLIMNDPAYFIMAHIDLAGGSTGYFRSRLIQSALEHFSEWWLYGTNYTRHWMPTGVPWSQNHTDITNYYLKMGVWGGVPLMMLFIFILVKGFSFVGKTLRQMPELSEQSKFMIWALGATLFTHAITFISVSYFDQSFVFLYLTLAAIGSTCSGMIRVDSRMPYNPNQIRKTLPSASS